MKRISVIVPVYNVERYLEKCLKHIIHQTYQNLDIILIDDGSTDSSARICDEYALRDSRIRVFHKDNQGVSSARNFGLDKAQGEYITFIDADDYPDLDQFEILINGCEKYDAQIAMCNLRYVYENKTGIIEKNLVEEKVMSPQEAYSEMMKTDSMTRMGIWNKIYKKETIRSERFNTSARLGEDVDFLCRITFNASKVIYIPVSKYNYLQRANSVSNLAYSHEKSTERLNMLEGVVEYIRRKQEKILINAVAYEYISGYLSTVNQMSLSNAVDDIMLKRIKKGIHKDLSLFLRSRATVAKKVQLLLCFASFRLYRRIFLFINNKRKGTF